ncbi:MAG TPA: pyridoxal-dependent decarboxylase [Candidatus Saccharimonadales bacterium]
MNQELKVLIDIYFNDNLVCASLYGSRARNENEIDANVDIIIITKNPVNHSSKEIFYKKFQDFCKTNNYKYDKLKPVEIIYIEDIHLALQGYGFILKDSKIIIGQIFENDWSAFNSSRKLLAGFATPSLYLTGDKNAYKALIKEAQRCVMAIISYNNKTEIKPESLEKILIGSGKEYLGFCQTNETRKYIKRIYANRYTEESNHLKYLPAIKKYEDYEVENEYLGFYESSEDWNSLFNNIFDLSKRTFQASQPLIYRESAELQKMIAKNIPERGIPFDSLMEQLDVIGKYSIHQNNLSYVAFPDSGNSKAAITAAIYVQFLNQNMIAVDKSAPIGTFIEIQLISWLRELIGYEVNEVKSALELGGIATMGGVMANTIGLLLARSNAFPNSRMNGLHQEKKTPYLLIADSTLEHYSHISSFWWLGMGEENIVKVKANGFDFDIDDLRAKIKQYDTDDSKVVAVICLAGDSRTTSIQNIKEIYELTSLKNIWLHVDACHGGLALFSSQKEVLCRDYHLADSICIDPHKVLGIPYSSSYCLFKDPTILSNVSKSTDITIKKGSFDLGQITPFMGSRPFDSLKLWSVINYHGMSGLKKIVDKRTNNAKKWAEMLNASDYFKVLHDPEITAVSFSINPDVINGEVNAETIGAINRKLHDICYKEGWLVLHMFDLIDFQNRLNVLTKVPIRVLGTNFGNALLDEQHLTKLIKYLENNVKRFILDQQSMNLAVAD